VKVGTILEASHIPVSKWLMVMHLISASKKGMSALQFKRMLGVGPLHGIEIDAAVVCTDQGARRTFLELVPLVDWCAEYGVAMHFIQPGKPDQNAYIERFNRTYRRS
jgi:hypothetical protein